VTDGAEAISQDTCFVEVVATSNPGDVFPVSGDFNGDGFTDVGTWNKNTDTWVIALHGGPRCCKRNTYLGIRTAVRFSRQYLEAPIKMTRKTVCRFYKLNKECIKEECPFFGV